MAEVEEEGVSHETPQGPRSVETYSKWLFWKRRRYIVAVLAFLGFCNVYTLRANMSIAIVAMTEGKNVTLDNGTQVVEKEYDWDSKHRGYVLGAFFYGYIGTMYFGGWVSARVGGKKVFAVAVGLAGLFSLLTPLSADISIYLLIIVRTFVGLFQGVTYPCIHAVWSRWAPPLERSRLVTIGFSGSYIGTVIAMPGSAYLATSFGWPSIFYVFGTLGVLWALFWCYYVAESPAEDPRITKEEMEFIEKSLGNVKYKRKLKIPYVKILTSAPVWAIVAAHFIDNWGFYTVLTQLPMFMDDTFGYHLGKTGFLSSFPYLAMAVCMQFSGHAADYLRQKQILTTTQVRKLFNCGAFLINAIFMVATVHVSTTGGTVACLTIAVGIGVCSWSGFGVNYLDVAPKFASVLMGFGNTFGTLGGIISPILTGYIVTTKSRGEWQIVFYIGAGLKIVGIIIYMICASGEVQPWAIIEES